MEDISVHNVTDEILAERAGRGCRESFHQLIHRYYKKILFFISGKIRSPEDAEDIVQNAFLNAYQGICSFDSKYRFKTWIFTIAHNCMVSYLREKGKNPKTVDLPVVASDRPQPEESVDDADCVRMVWQRARELPADQFTALWLRYHEQMAVGSIARIMHKSSVNVRVTLHRARNTIAQMIPEMDD